MSSTSLKTIAIFGATGGTGLAVLNRSLEAGHTVNVLARTPAKLSVQASKYPDQLRVIKGDIRDISTIKETLIVNGKVVDIIVSAIGMVFHRKGLSFVAPDTKVCAEGLSFTLKALGELEQEAQYGGTDPTFVLLSTTGISDQGRDIPVAMIPLYHWALGTAHKDKKLLEDTMVKGAGSNRKCVIIRPSLLFDGESKGMQKIRSSIEIFGASRKENDKGVAIGYSIHREDVGLWIVESCINGDASRWTGKMVTVTY